MSRYTRQQPRNRQGYEQANPMKPRDAATPLDVLRTKQRSGPVKAWKDMTPAERQRVMLELKPRGVRE